MSQPDPEAVKRWQFGDRFFGITLASAPNSMDLELDEVGASAGHETLMVASCDDDTADLTVRVFTNEALPLDLMEQFVAEARHRLPPRA